jgi:hypothetical protein
MDSKHNGIMEWWNDGILGFIKVWPILGLVYQPDAGNQPIFAIDPNPLFQYSNIPFGH